MMTALSAVLRFGPGGEFVADYQPRRSGSTSLRRVQRGVRTGPESWAIRTSDSEESDQIAPLVAESQAGESDVLRLVQWCLAARLVTEVRRALDCLMGNGLIAAVGTGPECSVAPSIGRAGGAEDRIWTNRTSTERTSSERTGSDGNWGV